MEKNDAYIKKEMRELSGRVAKSNRELTQKTMKLEKNMEFNEEQLIKTKEGLRSNNDVLKIQTNHSKTIDHKFEEMRARLTKDLKQLSDSYNKYQHQSTLKQGSTDRWLEKLDENVDDIFNQLNGGEGDESESSESASLSQEESEVGSVKSEIKSNDYIEKGSP